MAVFYVSPTGNDGNAGTIGSPFLTLTEAWSHLSGGGDTILMRGGTYDYGQDATLLDDLSGSSGNYINVFAMPGEYPVIDYGGETFTTWLKAFEIDTVDYLHVKGIRICNVNQPASPADIAQYGMWINGSTHILIENVECDHIGGWGFCTRHGNSDITYLNCDSHDNFDPESPEPYGGSDGWQCDSSPGTAGAQSVSTDIYYIGCRAWYNGDDGWDVRLTTGNHYWKNCWAFWNGYREDHATTGGNGEGLKIEGNGGTKKVENCLIFENRFCGIEDSDEEFGGYNDVELYNTTIFDNYQGITFNYDTPSVVRNCIAFNNSFVDFTGGDNTTNDHNDFDDGPTASASDFVSLNSSGMDGARQSNGDLPVKSFLHLLNNSPLRGAGLAISGLTTDAEGKAYNDPPSLGAYEYGTIAPEVLITSITVTGAGSATTISVDNGTLQMSADILPEDATNQDIIWSVINGTGAGYIDSSGLLTAQSNGTVLVVATSDDGSGIYGTIEITFSNQTADSLTSIVKSCWEFNEASGDAIDAKNVCNLPAFALHDQVGKLGKCYSFSGSLDYVGEIDTIYELQTISLWAWFKTSSTGSYKALMSNYYYATDEQGYDLTINNQNKIEWAVRNSISEYSIIESSTLVCDDAWHLAVVTFGSTYQKVYIDSVLEQTSAAWNFPITYHANSRFQIGVRQGELSYDGLMDQCGICDGELTQDQVDILWNDGNGIEYPFAATVLVTGITVTGAGSATTISTDNGTLQMSAAILPVDATLQTVLWSVLAGTGLASISTTGLLSAVSDGTVTVRATAQDGSNVYGDLVITISNQVVTYKNIAPVGWHVPTETEWQTLQTYLGGQLVAGKELKESGLIHWNTPNSGTNSTGFTGIGSSERSFTGGFVDTLKIMANYWSITEYDANNAYNHGLSNTQDWLYGGSSLKEYGQSLRFIKDDDTAVDTVADIDGNGYKCVKIGNQVWTAENSRVTRYNDGTPIPNITDNTEWSNLKTAGYCWYNNTPS